MPVRMTAHGQGIADGSEDAYGISIMQAELDYGVIDLSTLENWPIRNNAFYLQVDPNAEEVVLKDVRSSSQIGVSAKLRDVNFVIPFSDPLPLMKGLTYAVRVSFDPQGNRGYFEDRVEFYFQLPSSGATFVISRPVKALVTVEVHQRQLAPVAPYTRPKRQPRAQKGSVTITQGTKPSSFERQKTAWTYRLPEFPIPRSLDVLLGDGTLASKVEKFSHEVVPKGLTYETYTEFWQAVLWAEEHQARGVKFPKAFSLSRTRLTFKCSKDMENYDQNDVQFAGRFGQNYLRKVQNEYRYLALIYFLVEVPGLAERRPSVVIGDSVLVKFTGSRSNKWFRGFAHGIQLSHVMLGLHSSFSPSPSQRIDVEFELNRLLIQRQHLAVSSKYQEREVLFPSYSDVLRHGLAVPSRDYIYGITVFDKRVGTNPPQLQAVAAITRLPPGTVPFVIFGPPGTGKTVTLVEAIRQVLARQPRAKVLACAPSNNAADIITERLRTDLRPSELFRLNAPSRVKDLPHSLEGYTLRYDDGSFRVPAPSVIKQYRVVVATCASGAAPHGVGVEAGHFTHIFIDEAGQASEPEVMIPIKMNATKKTAIILAGDPKQLGPVIRSPVARRLGLDVSYLDRLMAMDMYKSIGNRGITHVKLIKNWRSHPAIIDFPNQKFYEGELEACADPVLSSLAVGWDQLPNPKYPIIFHAIKGQDMREASSPSWFNIEEASVVRDYVRNLRQDLRIGEEQMGVITPYRAQVRKMRTILRVDFPNVKVGTTEEFQGDERHAIIVSTVRSSLDFVEFDLRHTLGFVSNPRRFNVAMTRAKAILIVIGDPDVLGLDPVWRQFLNHVHTRGAWRGTRIPWNPQAEVPTDAPHGNQLRYDARSRRTAEQELQSLVARTSALGLDALDEMEELEADADLHWHEDE
ncbi:hypothetical protein FRC01_005776 [Tulasnella sp. 417]|nr:hypothetical protein FRC01_005776 [Tulasnella sp. 417]